MKNLVAIRPLSIEDTENIVKWRNSPEVKKNLYSQEELTISQHINYFHSFVETKKVIQFIISVIENGAQRDIGTTFLKNIDCCSRKTEFGIFIGEDNTRGKGYGSIATQLTIDYAFEILKLNRVYLSVLSENVAAIKAYKKCGFELEGIMKQDYLRDKNFIDVAIMGITKSNWERRKLWDK